MEFFDEFEIIGGIILNLIGLAVFCGVVIYFDQTRKAKVRRGEKVPHLLMLFIWALDTKRTRINRYRSYGWSWKKIAGIYGVSPTTARRWAMA